GTNKSFAEKEASKLYRCSNLCTLIYAHPTVIHFLYSLQQVMEDLWRQQSTNTSSSV
ncbi:unnamed protein product, partial [Bubo scandiacus]